MKKRWILFLSVMLLGMSLFCGCSKTEESAKEVQTEESSESLLRNMTTEEMKELFGQYDLTMVNIWATWCGPCVGEMPDLAALHKELPENVNMITVCTDSFEALQTAQDILKDCGAEFVTLNVNNDVNAYFMDGLTAYPTTLFVNCEGEFVGDAVIGAHTADQYMEEINARLES